MTVKEEASEVGKFAYNYLKTEDIKALNYHYSFFFDWQVLPGTWVLAMQHSWINHNLTVNVKIYNYVPNYLYCIIVE